MSHLLKKSASSASSLFSHCGTKLSNLFCVLALVSLEWLDVVISALFSGASFPEIPSVPPAAHTAAVVVARAKWGEKIPQDLQPSVGLAMLASGG